MSEAHKDSLNSRVDKTGNKYGNVGRGGQGEYSVACREGGRHNQLEATRFKNQEGTNLKRLCAQGFEDKWLFLQWVINAWSGFPEAAGRADGQ